MKTAIVLGLLLVVGCRSGEMPLAASVAPEAVSGQTLVDIDADSLGQVIGSHKGHALLVNVWSTWCAPCVEEIPVLIDVVRRYESRGLRLLLIAADPPALRGAALAFLEEKGAPFPSYLKTGSEDRFIQALHPDWSGSLPATLLIDARGKTQRFFSRPVDRKLLEPAIVQLLAGTTPTKDKP